MVSIERIAVELKVFLSGSPVFGSASRVLLVTLVISLLVLSGCATKTRVVRLPSPGELPSGALSEVEAALGEGKVVKGPKMKTGRIERLKGKVLKLKAKAEKLNKKLSVVVDKQEVFIKEMKAARVELKALENRANALNVEVESEGDKASLEIDEIVKEATTIAKVANKAKKSADKFGPKIFKARYKYNKVADKLKKAQDAVDEAVSKAESKLARAFSEKMDEVTVADIVAESEGADIILLGEVHSNRMHHKFQLEVITALVEAGKSVAIGMEMFMADSQGQLNSWVDGELGTEDFRVLYYTNWKTPWRQYAPILKYAREKKIDLVALSIERSAINRVFVESSSDVDVEAEDEFVSVADLAIPELVLPGEEKLQHTDDEFTGEITPEIEAEIEKEVEKEVKAALVIEEEEEELLSVLMSREELEAITCEVEPEYKKMIKDAMGEHADDMNFQFDRFCRIQVAWDTAMAHSAKQYIEDNPDGIFVIIAGGMHAWKLGIPKQLTRLGKESIGALAEARVVAKEAKERVDVAKKAVKEAEGLAAKADSIATRARVLAREARRSTVDPDALLGVKNPEDEENRAPVEPADKEMAADAEAASDLAKGAAKDANARLEELKEKYKSVRDESKAVSKRLKALKKSKSEFKSLVVVPEMPEYDYFRSGGASSSDADYLILH